MTASDTPPGHATRAGQPAGDPATITVTVWDTITRDGAGRYTGFHYGFRPGDQMVKVFTCQTGVRGRRPEDIAEDAYAAFNGFPRDGGPPNWAHPGTPPGGSGRCRSPGNFLCCGRSCWCHRCVVWARSPWRWWRERASRTCLSGTRR